MVGGRGGGGGRGCRLTHLHEFPGKLVGEELLLLLVVDSECLLLLLQGLNLLEERVADELLLLFRARLLQMEDTQEPTVMNSERHTHTHTHTGI